MPGRDEEEQLRSVALQNAQSILQARQKAEAELVRAKEALEARTAELAHSLAMMRATLESTTDGILVTDDAGKITHFNGRFAEMWRLPREVLDGGEHRKILELTAPQFRAPEAFLRRVQEIYASSPAETYDSLELADGRVFERFSRTQTVGERSVGRVWSFRDITQRRQAERHLAEERQRLQITLASIGDAVISTDAQGRVVFLNGVAESLTGWSQADAAGRPLPDVFTIINEDTREPVEQPALVALREGRVVGLANHTVLVAREGAERPIADSAAPMRDDLGATIGSVLVFRDVSEYRRSGETRARLAAIVESSEDAIVSKTLEGIIRSWNAGAERLFGYTSAEAVGRSITLIIPPERLDEERVILDRLRRGERIEHFETVRVAKDGRRIDISLTVSPVRDGEGRIVGASKVARDITERKRAEQAQREADRRKDEFLALLAHELRNPLAPLRNGLQVMRISPNNPAAVAEARAMMERQLGHMVRLVDDLLDVSRISRNKLELRRTRVLLSDVIHSAVETARPVIDAAGHTLSVSLPAEPVHLDADLTRLAQVFGNLLTNSAKYTQRGGRIWLTAEHGNGEAVVSVRDTGIGIPAESLPTIFDMFSQVNRSIERDTGGLGIGLAIVKGLVEMHGGTVTAKSPGVGMGSMFTVRLPALDDHPARAIPEPPEEEQAAGGTRRRILVVDDIRDSANSLAMLLRLLGNEVRTAHDGVEALDAAERFRPQVILMDMGMPRLNGYEATRRIRERPWGREVVIIALTGWGQEGDKVRSREAGCNGHLVKPVNLPELEQMLEQYCGAG